MSGRRIALIGAKGMLAQQVIASAAVADEVVGFDLPEFDLTNREQVIDRLGAGDFDLIINCAAYTNVDGCESAEELATSVNGAGPGYLAEAALEAGAVLVQISTDYVFAGDQQSPYREEDPVGPASAYGRSKLAGETAILNGGLERFFIIRTSWLFGPGGKNFVETILRLAAERPELSIVNDQTGSPTLTEDLAQAIFRLLETEDYGIYHFSNAGSCSWFELAGEIVRQAVAAGVLAQAPQVRPIATEDYPLPAQRPAYSVMSTQKYRTTTSAAIQTWPIALARYFELRNEFKHEV